MSYAYETFAELKTALAKELGDPAKVHWVDTELGILLNCAFREFNAIARIFRDRGSFQTDASTTYYDLTLVLKNGAGTAFLSPTVTDNQLIQQLKYMLVELNSDDTTTFSDGLSLAQIQNAITQRRNQFLLETGLIISQPAPQVVSAGEGLVQLVDDSIIDIRRVTWTALDGIVTQLYREDGFTSAAASPRWPQQPGMPQRYSIYPSPLVTLQLIPPPIDNGTLTIQSISSAAQLLNDFTPCLLWGVLADVLNSPGPINDPQRATYAEQRWNEGLIVGRQVTTVMQSYINGIPVTTESVFNFDGFQPRWQVPGTPQSIGLLGSNLAVAVPVADGVYSITADAVTNAPQLEDSSQLPFGREYVDLFIDYALHLAVFKHGGDEFQATLPRYDNFVKTAVAYNNRMNYQNLNFDTLIDRAKQQESQVALRLQEVA